MAEQEKPQETKRSVTTESKRQRSVRITNRRTSKALASIEMLKVLCSPNYDINAGELTKISEAVSDAVVELQTVYETGHITASGFCLS